MLVTRSRMRNTPELCLFWYTRPSWLSSSHVSRYSAKSGQYVWKDNMSVKIIRMICLRTKRLRTKCLRTNVFRTTCPSGRFVCSPQDRGRVLGRCYMRILPDSVEFCALSLKLSSLKLDPRLRKKTAARMVVVMRRMRMAMETPRMFVSNCSFGSSLSGNWRFKANLDWKIHLTINLILPHLKLREG